MSKYDYVLPLPLLLLLLTLLGVSACAPSTSATASGDPNFGITPRFVNPAFEVAPSQSLVTGDTLWIDKSAGDGVVLRWHDFSTFINRVNATCDFENPNSDCQRCNSCASHDIPDFCVTFPVFSGFFPIQVHRFDGIVSPVAATPSETINPTTIAGCDTSSGIQLAPPSNATYKLVVSPEFTSATSIINTAADAEVRVHVIDGGSDRAKYLVSSIESPGTPTTVKFYAGTVPTGMRAPLQDGFSEHVSISKVRVLLGNVENDPVNGGITVTNASLVKPSRVVFAPDFHPDMSVFSQDGIRCYANYTMSIDGDIDLTRCRHDPTSTDGQLLAATPILLRTSPADRLSWIVEFNPDDFAAIGGGEIPTRMTGQDLVIEFTIQ